MTIPVSLNEAIGRMAGVLGSRRYSPGDLAELRRMDEIPGAAFWKLMAHVQPQLLEEERPAQTRAWVRLTREMARLAGFHAANTPLGEALAKAKVSEMRFNRLLRADDAQIDAQLRAVVHQLAAAAQPFNQVELGQLVLSTDDTARERIRLKLARDYYRSIQQKGDSP